MSTTKPARRNLVVALFIALFAFVQAPAAGAAIVGLDGAEPPIAEYKQSYTLKLVSYLIDKSHYRKRPLDNALSEAVFDAYLRHLDPARQLFIAADVAAWQAFRHEFDDFIRAGDLHMIFEMFNTMRMRMDERAEFALARLQRPFDFALDEEYRFDRADVAWAKDRAELDELWRKRIKNDILNLRLADKDEDDILETLESRYTHMARRLRQFTSEDVFALFANAYLSAIDPHSAYFSPRANENFKIQMRLSLEGIGAVLQTDDEYTQVLRIIPGGPAEMGGELQAEDRIIGVAQGAEEMVDVIGWRLDDVVDLIRGPKESIVRLEVLPGADGPDAAPEVISIRRDKINLEEMAAKKRILKVTADGGRGDTTTIGVIDLPSFYIDFDGLNRNLPEYRSTTRDVRKLLAELAADEIDGLIIDLRGNSGGALTEAIELTGLFIRQGPVVQVRNVRGQVHVDRDPDPAIVYEGPLAVLVDRYSASASEIFAGAIQDYGRGIIIGEPTFGKGTVQHLVDLNRYAENSDGLGHLKLTVAQFFRVNGDSTQHRGVIPDIVWPTAEPEETGERVADNAIPWRNIHRAAYRSFREESVADEVASARKLHQERMEDDPEFQYFMEIKAENAVQRERKVVSLNQESREEERAARDAERLARENRKRRALGEDEFADVQKLDEDEEAQDKAELENPGGKKADAFLREGSRILTDYLNALPADEPDAEAVTKGGGGDNAVILQ